MFLLLAMLFACNPQGEDLDPPVVAGPPRAGAAEGTLDLPVGTPMGGFSARCQCLSGQSYQDTRASAYSSSFVESTGMQMRPQIKAIWLANGDDNVVMIEIDVIYSYDNLVAEVTRQLEAATGERLQGKVIVSANHSHHSFGPFSDGIHWYLGGDFYNEEIFQRMASEVVEVAMDAWSTMQPAAIGMGWAKDWDPNNEIYSDRRGENDDLVVWEDGDPGTGKDPHLGVMRVDTAAGDPIAIMYTFGIHGIALSETNSMISGDAPQALDVALQEHFDTPVVVMHTQGAGGDASPRGRDHGFARLETIGELARDRIISVWEDTPTTSDPIRMETASRHIWEHRSQIEVTRNGTVDWRYREYEEDYESDGQVYDDNGDILSPIDEFNAPYGAAFCGDGDFDIPVGGIGTDVFPYAACLDVELVTALLYAFFDEIEPESIPLPLPSTYKAGTTAGRFGPLPTLEPDGTVVSRDLLVGWFPGEPLSMYAEQWRRRAKAELGYDRSLLIGYAQDHEGYLLIPEDWLMGGYEPNIAIWGPLQGEHIMEGTIALVDEVLQDDVHNDPDPTGWYEPTTYPVRDLPMVQPDTTPTAGTRLTEPPEYYWLPEGFTADLATPTQIDRVTGMVQLGWIGGDPMVDLPVVTLQVQDGTTWVDVQTHSGRTVTDAFQDILLAHTPDPLYPVAAEQTHYWWATWQAVGHDTPRLGLPVGTYRLHVAGKKYVGGDATWPWGTADYEVTTDPFELVEGALHVETDTAGVWVSVDGPADGYRMIDLDGDSTGRNPVRGLLDVTVVRVLATNDELQLTPSRIENGRAFVEVNWSTADFVEVTDAWGNYGAVALPQ